MPRRLDLWISAALAAFIVAAYAQVHSFDFVAYDDDLFLSRNPYIRGGWDSIVWAFKTGYAANWHPLTWLSYIAGYRLYGFDPGWHHLTNVFFHALATIVLYAALRRMTEATWPSAFVAFIFALHPLHVEAVAWIAERKEVLGGLFWTLTLWTYARYVERPRPAAYLLVIAMFVCGLMSKSMIVTLPFVLLLLDFWPLKRPTPLPRLIAEKIPLLALSAAASVVTFRVQQTGGAVSSLTQVPLYLRVENALISYVIYAAKFVWPADLAVIYPFDENIPIWQPIAAAILLAAIATLAILQFKRRPYLTVGALWFLGTLVPVIGIVQIGVQSRADRYTYIPLIGLAIAVAWTAAEFPKPAMVAAAIACPAFFAITCIQTAYWQNSATLFQHAVDVTDDNWMALSALSHVLIDQNRLDEAAPFLERALQLRPNNPEAHVNYGTAFSKRGDFARAETEFSTAVRLDPHDPDSQEGLGMVLLEQRRFPEAEAHLLESLRMRPDDADTHYNLGRLYGLSGDPKRAIQHFSESVRLSPASPENRFNLGTALASADRFEEACTQFRAAIALRPDYAKAHYNLGGALAGLARYNEAIAEFKEVLRLDPQSSEAQAALEEFAQPHP